MDWSKAKTILILAFLITDLFLIFTYGLPGESAERISAEQKQEVSALLESKNIYVKVDIPEEHRAMPTLPVQRQKADEREVDDLLRKQELLPAENLSDEEYEKTASAFIRKCGLACDSAVLDRVEREDGKVRVVYQNKKDEFVLEKSEMICTFTGRKISAFDYDWLCPGEFNKKKQSTISAAAALFSFLSQKKGEEAIYVEEIKMVYWLDESFDTETAVSDTALPAWKIVYNGDQVQYIDAYGSSNDEVQGEF